MPAGASGRARLFALGRVAAGFLFGISPADPVSLGVAGAALLGAGVFSLLLVVSRTPYLSEHIPWIDFFHSALVVHVNLSVLVWSLAFGGILWSLNQRPGFNPGRGNHIFNRAHDPWRPGCGSVG